MNLWFAAMICAALSIGAAQAADVTLKLAPETQGSIAQLPSVMDKCVADLTLRGEASACKSLSGFLAGLAEKVNAEARAAVKAEADKVAADKAAADKTAAEKAAIEKTVGAPAAPAGMPPAN